MNKTTATCLATLALLGAATAQAATLATLADGGLLDTQQSTALAFASGTGAGSIDFTLYGSNTLDGDNFWIDIFSLRLDGQLLLSGTWTLNGGGTDRVLDNPSGATVTRLDTLRMQISAPVTLLAGPHSLVFAYDSPATFEGTGRAGFQGLPDEGWGVSSVTVSGVAAVPEPAAAGLLLAGLAVLGARRRFAPRLNRP